MKNLKSKILHLLTGIFIGALLCVSLYSIPQAVGADWERSLPFTPQQLAIIKQVKLALSTYQVDGDKEGKIDDTQMYYGALRGLVASIDDPYTRFVDPEALAEENMEIEGEYGGLGIYMANRDGRTTVIAPIEDTPADRAGIKPLDEIIKVDDKTVVGMESNEIVKMLRGEPGTPVTLHIRRKDESKLIPVKIVREVIKIKTVRLEMLGGGIAYIKLNHFNLKTDEELRAADGLFESWEVELEDWEPVRDAALALIDDLKQRRRAALWDGTFEVVDAATGERIDIEKEQSQVNFMQSAQRFAMEQETLENMAFQMGMGPEYNEEDM